MINQFEVWRNINGYEGLYQVSTLGRVKSLDRKIKHIKNGKDYFTIQKGKLKALRPGDDGYLDVGLYKNNKAKFYSVHRLVAETFIPNPKNKPTVNHKDGNKQNNRVSNLEWATCKEQMEHASKTGLLNYRKINPEKYNPISIANIQKWNMSGNNCKKVECIESGLVYSSIREACKLIGCSIGKLTYAIENNLSINGMHYRKFKKEVIK